MTLTEAKKILAEMHKHFRGEWLEALQVLGGTLRLVSQCTHGDGYKPSGFIGPDLFEELWKLWPENEE